MQGGRLRNRIEVWKYFEIKDDMGQPVKTYEKVTDAYAEIRPLLGRESYAEKMENTLHTHKIMMRYIHLPIDATMQIRYNGRVFEVIGDPINWMERNIFIQFNCSENFEHDVNHPE